MSDFGSVTAQTISPPSITPDPPDVVAVLAMGLLAGLRPGGRRRLPGRPAGGAGPDDVRAQVDPRAPGDRRGPPADRRAGRRSRRTSACSATRSPRSFLAESYKSARTNIEFLRRNRRAQVILISSPNPGDGKSTTSSNLAITLALAGRKVLLIDGDLRKPSLHAIYGLSRERGLVSILQGEDTLAAGGPGRRRSRTSTCWPPGPEASNPAELLASDHLARCSRRSAPIYDVVIFDTSPLPGRDRPVDHRGGGRRHPPGRPARGHPPARHRADHGGAQDPGRPVLGMIVNGVTREKLVWLRLRLRIRLRLRVRVRLRPESRCERWTPGDPWNRWPRRSMAMPTVTRTCSTARRRCLEASGVAVSHRAIVPRWRPGIVVPRLILEECERVMTSPPEIMTNPTDRRRHAPSTARRGPGRTVPPGDRRRGPPGSA